MHTQQNITCTIGCGRYIIAPADRYFQLRLGARVVRLLRVQHIKCASNRKRSFWWSGLCSYWVPLVQNLLFDDDNNSSKQNWDTTTLDHPSAPQLESEVLHTLRIAKPRRHCAWMPASRIDGVGSSSHYVLKSSPLLKL